MAKEQLHNWGRYILLGIVIIFGTGGWVVTVRSNAQNIGKLQEKTEVLQDDVHRIELNAKDVKNVAIQGVEALTSINTELKAIRQEQARSATIQAVNSTKLESLTKD